MNGYQKKKETLSSYTIGIMALASGLTVANIYYIQPLVGDIAASYHITEGAAGLLASLMQAGYALGMLFLLPLADIMEKRRLILFLLWGAAAGLFFLFLSPGMILAVAAALGIGFFSVVPQLLIPLAAQLAGPERIGVVIGNIMSGLMMGILLSRMAAGFIGAYFSWQYTYLLAACAMAVLWFLLRRTLPGGERGSSMTYKESLASMAVLIREFPALRRASFVGSMAFLAFSAFWTAATLFLEGPGYRMGSDMAGLLSLAGLAGILCAPAAGRLSDRRGPRFTVAIHISVIFLSCGFLAVFGHVLWGLVSGAALLNLGFQACNVGNQTIVQQLDDAARNRMASIYMVSFFLVGSIGSWLGAAGYSHFGWTGVCLLGMGSQCLAMWAHFSKRWT